MKNWLDNKTVIITGASSGIGKELTKLFISKNNCKVIGVARNEQKMKQFVEELGNMAANFSYELFDVSDEAKWKEFAGKVDSVDLLVNNAGIFYKFDNFLNIDEKQGEQIMNVNFYSVVYGCRNFLPKLSQKGGIVNICSSDALLSVAGTNYYAASKGAVKCFSQSLAYEFPKKYIACMFPGFTKTELFRDIDFTAKETRLLNLFMSTSEKIAKKIYRAIRKRKKYKVVGYDARIFNMFSKLNSNGGAKLINGVLKKTKLDMFSTITNENL